MTKCMSRHLTDSNTAIQGAYLDQFRSSGCPQQFPSNPVHLMSDRRSRIQCGLRLPCACQTQTLWEPSRSDGSHRSAAAAPCSLQWTPPHRYQDNEKAGPPEPRPQHDRHECSTLYAPTCTSVTVCITAPLAPLQPLAPAR